MKAVIDACVLYGFHQRAILLYLAEYGVFEVFWSEKIEEEWVKNLKDNKGNTKEAADKIEGTCKRMREIFPNACIKGFQDIIELVKMKDLDDRHVVAAAVTINADYIITENSKDFRGIKISGGYTVPKVCSTDSFLEYLYKEDRVAFLEALEIYRTSLDNPPYSREGVIKILREQGITSTAMLLSKEVDW